MQLPARASRRVGLVLAAVLSLAALAPIVARAATPGFSVNLSPGTQSVARGTSGTYAVTVSASGGFAGSVSLAVTGIPAGVAATLAPAVLALPKNGKAGSALVLNVDLTTAPGSYPVTVTGTSGTLTRSTSATLTVPRPDFAVGASPPDLSVAQGSSATYQVSVSPVRGFTGPVALSTVVGGSGVSGTLSPPSVTLDGTAVATATLTVTASLAAPATTRKATITAAGGGSSHSVSVSLTVVPAPDFSIATSPTSLTVPAGSSAPATVTVTSLRGFAGAVALSASGLPAGATATFLPPSASLSAATPSATSTLTIATAAGTPAATSTVTIRGTAGGLSHTVTLSLKVTARQGLVLSASPSTLLVIPGSSRSTTVTLTRTNTPGSATFAVTGLPGGTTASFSPASTSGSTTTLTLAPGGSVPDGSYPLTVSATASGVTATTTVTLVVETPGSPFTISGGVAGLAPGVTRPIDLAITNPGGTALPVTNLTVTLAGTTNQPGCLVSANYSVTQYSGSYPLTVPAHSTVTLSALGVPQNRWPAITMLNLATNQDACKGAALTLTYTGSAAGGVTP